ncbi:MAG: AAA family ATPase [Planctomycetes bacterium]|jgi:predicted ATPase|nr:AAA family ATPase [Planctomycetota bacterium]
MRNQLQRLTLRGFKTIGGLESFEPGPLTVLIGPNGAGKSNFISFFRLLSWALASPGGLQVHVAELGGASALLHDGPEVTREIEGDLTIATGAGENQYVFRLVYAAGDTLIYTDERYRFSRTGFPARADWQGLDAGHRESRLMEKASEDDQTARTILHLLRRMTVYQFHNTSATARMRGKWDVEDGRWLKEDGANIAPFLCRLQNGDPKSYRRIVDTIRLILPFFADFEFESSYGKLLLSWREKGCDRVFNASQAADGMLRAMAMVTLLLQPEQDLPDVLILDEPELGLHPYAINVIGGLIRSAATNTQVIIATQSMLLVDCFKPEEIVVVERKERKSEFRRLEASRLQEWLEDYSLSELWEKNVIGGRPS